MLPPQVVLMCNCLIKQLHFVDCYPFLSKKGHDMYLFSIGEQAAVWGRATRLVLLEAALGAVKQ